MAIEKIKRVCKVSPGIEMIEYESNETYGWKMRINKYASEEQIKDGIEQAKKMKIPYETGENEI